MIKQQQIENFNSTVSHEMRTPLGTSQFFLTQVIDALNSADIDPQVLHYLQLIMSQLTFMKSFVEDLLDMRQIRDGVFSLSQAPFSPKEVLALVCKIFKPQADFKNVKLYAEISKQLKPPN